MKVRIPEEESLNINLGDLFYSKKNDDFYILIADDVEDYFYLQSLKGVYNLYADKQITNLIHLENVIYNGEDSLIHYSKYRFDLKITEKEKE